MTQENLRVRPQTEEEQNALIARCHCLLNEGISNTPGSLDVRVHAAAVTLDRLNNLYCEMSHRQREPNTPYTPPTGGHIPSVTPTGSATPSRMIESCDAILDDRGIAIGLHYTLEGRVEHLIGCVNATKGYIEELMDLRKSNA